MDNGTGFERSEAVLQPSPAVFALLEEGLNLQRAGAGEQAGRCYQAALEAAIEHGDGPGQARALGQLAVLAEAGGAIPLAQEHNLRAIELFLALGDGAGLVQSYRLNGFIHLRLGQLEQAATEFARAMALALQLDIPLVAATLNQIVPVARYLVEHSQTAGLLPLGAALNQAVHQVGRKRGT
jgi:tetratricopeptide (TPR) repeat protein